MTNLISFFSISGSLPIKLNATLAFPFMIPVNNELGSCGGTGVALKYQKKDNYKISIYKFE